MIGRALIGTLVFIVCILSDAGLVHAQGREKKGYFALNGGPAWLPGNYFDGSRGFQMNLEVGYDFVDGFGVAATWLGAAFEYENTYYLFDGSTTQSYPANVQAGYSFLGLGPMYSIKVSPSTSIDIKGRVGRFYYKETAHGNSFSADSENTSVGYLIGASCQQRMTKWWSFFGSIDYGNGRKAVTVETYQPVHSLQVAFGVGVRL